VLHYADRVIKWFVIGMAFWQHSFLFVTMAIMRVMVMMTVTHSPMWMIVFIVVLCFTCDA